MSSFYCPECGALCSDSPRGYTTGCKHYPADAVSTGATAMRLNDMLLKLNKPIRKEVKRAV